MAALQDFQAQMRDLQELIHDEQTTEFCIVTIPTALALTESERLLLALRTEGIAVRRGVLNRLIDEDQQKDGYLGRLSKGQLECLNELGDLASRCDVSVTRDSMSSGLAMLTTLRRPKTRAEIGGEGKRKPTRRQINRVSAFREAKANRIGENEQSQGAPPHYSTRTL